MSLVRRFFYSSYMVTFAFVWRLTAEKGFDSLLETWTRLEKEYPKVYPYIRVFIFWDGELRASIPSHWFQCEDPLDTISHPHLLKNSYFWRREPSEIWEFLWQNAEYTMMPSRFLETFGLVALESLASGIPIIGFQMGGVAPFIHDELALRVGDTTNSLIEMVTKKIVPWILEKASLLKDIDLSPYSHRTWRSNLKSLVETDLGNPRRVLVVNDYTDTIGGAEHYSHFLVSELERMGKTVFFTGYDAPISQLKRKWNMFLTPFDFTRWRRMSQIIKRFHPDCIWCQSTLRYIGPWGMHAIAKSGVNLVITHHDLWLFSPRPSQVFHESDIPKNDSLGEFVRASWSRNIISLIVIFSKWCYLRVLFFSLKKIPLHLVPSQFMVSHVSAHGIPKEHIRVFQHTRIEKYTVEEVTIMSDV